MSRYQAYSEYKDSGIPWLGNVPSHWVVSKVKHLTSFQVGWTPPTKDDENFEGDNLWANISDLKGREIFETAKRVSDDAVKTASMTIALKGSLLYSFKLSVGAVSFAGNDMYTNEAIASFLEESKLPLAYLYYVLPKYLIENASTNIYGARILNQELICNANLIAPKFEEAQNIAAFLDHETAKIDALIEKQQRLIELLKEKRQAVISHAITKGLNPNAPMKDSGVEWLGEAPAHWEFTRLGWICSEINDINHVMPMGVEQGVPFLSAKDLLDDGTLNFTSDIKMISEQDFANLSKKVRPRRGDIIYSRIGACLGKARLVETDTRFLISYSCCVVRILPERASQRFIQHLLDGEMILTEARMRTQGIGVPDLGLREISRFPVPLPPLAEQEIISDYLDQRDHQFRTLAARTEQAISLLQERRTALISAAVTGKIDVRDWQAAA